MAAVSVVSPTDTDTARHTTTIYFQIIHTPNNTSICPIAECVCVYKLAGAVQRLRTRGVRFSRLSFLLVSSVPRGPFRCLVVFRVCIGMCCVLQALTLVAAHKLPVSIQ